jgi:hypothetical protein
MKKMAAILNKMAAISCVDKKTSHPTECAQHCGIVFKISIMAHIAIILSENNLSDIIIEEKQSLKPLLMAAILGKLLTKNRQFQMLITFEPFIRFLQMKAL